MGFLVLKIEFRNLGILSIILAASLSSLAAITPPNSSLAKPNCPEYCGNLRIPYPFGTSPDCYLSNEFFVNCSQSSKAFLAHSTIEITDISLDGQLTVLKSIAYDCHGQNQRHLNNRMTMGLFTINNTANKFTVVGCDTIAYLTGWRRQAGRYFQTGCVAMCRDKGDLESGACTGSGCCQMSLPKHVRSVSLQLRSFWNYANVSDFNDCGFAFVAEEGAFTFSGDSMTKLKEVKSLPLVIDWDIGYGTDCDEAKMNISTYACKSVNSECYVPDNGNGYRCSCKQGYQGNPYLDGGCEDIDECQNENNNCEDGRNCKNTQGSYECMCPEGYHGDGKKEGKGCSRC